MIIYSFSAKIVVIENRTILDQIVIEQWRSQGEHGCMSPRRSWKLAFVSGFWGLRLQIPTGALPLDLAGGLPFPDPLFCPPISKFLAIRQSSKM